MGISRRDFLGKSLVTGTALVFGSRIGWPEFADAQAPVPGKERLIIRSLRFYDLETPVNLLDSWITPVNLFFVRNHMSEPTAFDSESYRLKITGEVEHPLELSLADLSKMEPATVTNTLECAGNGRAFYEPRVPGVQWQRGAVGNARWTGPRLKDVLQRAGVKETGRFIAFVGLDEPPSKVPQFIRGIPVDKAMDPDTLLAMRMNGGTLLKHHGFPVRAMTPGWIGAASCKWLTEIRVLDKEFDGNFMKPGYRLPVNPVKPGGDVVGDTQPITRLNVKSIFTRPSDGTKVKVGRDVPLTGVAWAGEAQIKAVYLSADAGQTWAAATELGPENQKYAWRTWRSVWKPPKPGEYIIMVSATDSTRRKQPSTSPWNPSGYLWNGYDQVKLYAER